MPPPVRLGLSLTLFDPGKSTKYSLPSKYTELHKNIFFSLKKPVIFFKLQDLGPDTHGNEFTYYEWAGYLAQSVGFFIL